MMNLVWQPGMTLEQIEKSAILQAFRFYRGNKTTTSRSLGISIRTLDAKLEKYTHDRASLIAREDAEQYERENFLQRQRGNKALDRDKFLAERRSNRAKLEAKSKSSEDTGSNADAGMDVEPASETSEKHGVSVSIGKEVQDVPSQQAARIGASKRR